MTAEQPSSERFPSRSRVRERDYSHTPDENAAKDLQGKWVVENKAALESSNRWVHEHGLPLAKYRMF